MTTEFNFTTAKGKPYNVVLPDPKPNFSSKFVFSFAKSGSTLLNDLLFTYCQQRAVPIISVFDQGFSQGLTTAEIGQEAASCFERSGYIFSGFRHFPNFNMQLGNNKCIWLVRDPRDMVVSMYYSVTKSHHIPDGNESLRKSREEAMQKHIDDFVEEKINSYVGQFQTYRNQLANKQVKIYRYEDVIYDKKAWFADVLDYLEVEKQPSLLSAVVKQFDLIPEQEEEAQHIRQVHPGNYKKKLSKASIDSINTKASEFLSYFNYEK